MFLVALAIEHQLVSRYSRRRWMSALACAAVDQLAAAWGLVLFLGAFVALRRSIGMYLPVARPLTWLIAIALHDVAYYTYHRASHRVNMLWAAHVVHHQGSTYDFTVSLRQGAIATWITYAFYLPLAIVIDAQMFFVVHAAYQIYQFFVHTRAIGRLGPLESLFATPNHHRVHHGFHERHLDRNYGGFFIVFDRLLGTFTRDDREPTYGVPGGYDMASPLFANTYMFARLVAASGRVASKRELIRLWLGPPEASSHLISAAGHAPRASEGSTRVWIPFVLGCAGTVGVVFARSHLPLALVVLIALASVGAFEVMGARLDGRLPE